MWQGGRQKGGDRDTRKEARRNRRLHFLIPVSPLSRSLGQIILPLFTCRAGLPDKQSIAVRGYWGISKGRCYNYMWPEDPGVHKSCLGPVILLPIIFPKKIHAEALG